MAAFAAGADGAMAMTMAATELDAFACPLGGVALIEASAGTGKTWNICALYLRQLLERDLPAGRLLVVTFTRAATAELATRIRERIAAVLWALDSGHDGDDPFISRLLAAARGAGVDDENIRRRLRNALEEFGDAAIFTIHGFCQRILIDAPFTAGLPYVFEVSEDDSDLRLEVTRDFWRREVAVCDAALAECLLAHRDSPETWAQWLKEAQARPLARVLWDEDTADEAADDAALAAAYEAARSAWNDDVMAALEAARDGLNKNSYKSGAIQEAWRQWAQWMAADEARFPLPVEYGRLSLFTPGRLKITKEGQKRGIAPPAHPFFAAAQDVLEARMHFDDRLESARLRLLRRFIEGAGEELRRRKRSERRVCFNDILWNAHDALASGEQAGLAAALHARYPVALIDEFQDTDPLQLQIFRRIYDSEGRHGSLFLVGDPKQAIYSFRGADIHTYLDARALADAHYTLGVNRRSAPRLVAACNHLFGANPAAFMEAGLDFHPVQAHEPSRRLDDRTESGDGAALRLWRIPRGEGDDGGAGGERLPRAQVFARAAAASAAEIARLLAAGRRGDIRIGERTLAPDDLAVLVRNHREGARMKAALAAKGVGSVELSQSSVFASREAEELERVLRAVADPARESLLKTALATTLMGWNAAMLARLADDDDGLARQFELFALWRDLWRGRGFAVMLWRWMTDAGVAARLLAHEDGERRLTNLLHLAELLQRESADVPPGRLARALARLRAESSGENALLRLESERDLVRIVTIHHAKGLQYGVVFCPFLFDGRRRAGGGKPMRLWHGERGQAAQDACRQVVDWRRKAAEREDIEQRIALEDDAETLRLIYVALTRAEHRCYLVAGCYAGNSASHKESARSLLNWLAAGAGAQARDWRQSEYSPAEIDARWRGLANASGGAIGLEDLPAGDGAPLAASGGAAKFFAARAPKVPEGWRLGSFSAMLSGATHETAARDHDARAEPAIAIVAAAAPPPAPAPDDDILRFPRGAAAGDCVHAVFEAIDFTRPETRAPAIDKALAAHPQTAAEAEAARLPRMLARLVDDVLATPLCGGGGGGEILRLGEIPMERRLTELEFYLPAPHLTAEALNGWLAAHGYGVPRLASRDLAGYLKGYIDLVFEHGGRYWILDWKSNHLGDAPAAYAPAALAAAMARHGYHLQHLLYTIALHRHLRRTLPGYDYQRHFGGALYLFVRGVRPDWRIDDAPAGVFLHRATAQAVASLDTLLATGEAGDSGA
ncbi:MAG: exodeoxyribonuclease V subunit beta [Azoarcus sp.]|jgi:exodeoxyribonuclease V beta subunit|nr:exodeoxyribonuclease V subunit beta [Azoarcus sp.]